MDNYPFERKSVEIDGFKYTYVETGNSTAKTILFLHNGGGDHRCWVYQLRDLANEFHCVSMDLPGFGDSTRPETTYSVEWIASRVRPFIEKQFKTPITIFGHCIGAAVAMEVAQQIPERIERLGLVNVCGGPPGMSSDTQLFYRLMPKGSFWMRLIYPLMKYFIESKGVQRKSLEQLFADPDDLKNLGVVYEMHVSSLKIQHISRKNLLLGMPSFAKYSRPFPKDRLKMPIQLVWGEKNTVMMPRLGAWMSEYLGAPIHWMKKGRHMVMSEEPEVFNDVLRRFMAKPEPLNKR